MSRSKTEIFLEMKLTINRNSYFLFNQINPIEYPYNPKINN